ncbi:MAG TPA: PilZ domain-containing protein [Xanthomonadaceae bacterium]|nr:PilZ domain-containing protein [Xanthomonadaceae bacterium]
MDERAPFDTDPILERQADRIACNLQIILQYGESAWLVDVTDISIGGCGILRPPSCDIEAEEVVTLIFPSRPGPAAVVTARVARVDQSEMGFEYHDIQAIPPKPPRWRW